MAKFIVIALSVGGLNNKVYELNDEVSSESFHEGVAEQLVEKGFLKRVEDQYDIKALKKMSKDTLIEELTSKGIEFDPAFSKEELIELLTA